MIERISKLTKQMPASFPDLEGILEQKGILGMAQRLNLNYSLDTWVYHDRKAHNVFVDAGIRLFSPVCGCVGMVHMTNLGPGSGLLLSRIDIGLPGILPPKTAIFAHQMEPVDTPDHFENEVKELIEHFPMILDKWTSSKAHYERERKKEESERKEAEAKRQPADELPSMPAPAEPPTVTCPRVDNEPVAAPEKEEPPAIVCPREQPTQEGFVTVERTRKVDGDGTVVYEVFDANNEKNAICTFPKVMIREFDRKLHDAGLAKSASLGDDGHIKLDWSW